MPSSFTKYVVKTQSGPIEAQPASQPTDLEPTDVMIRIKAAAINPADCKMIFGGSRGASWPLVPGLDGAGIIESVGSSVTRFSKGDRVLTIATPGDRGASFQELAVMHQSRAAKIPEKWTFEDAASLGVCYFTATVGLGLGLKTPLPYLQEGPQDGLKPSSVLVLGGSSALGAAILQLVHLAVPGCTVLTTSSTKHHAHLTGNLGADKAFDRTSASLIADIKAATRSGRGVDAIIDAVGAARDEQSYFDAFDPNGPRKYAQVWTGEDEIAVPEGVDSVMFRSRDALQIPGGSNIMFALETLLSEGKYKLPLPVRVVGQGSQGLQKGLDLVQKGVSGEKLVAQL